MRILAGALLTIIATPSASAAEPPSARPEVLVKLVECRKIANDTERLRCLDQQLAAFDDAEQKRNIVVVDREEIRRTKRSLFGLTLPTLKLFGGDNDASDPEFTTIETTIASAERLGSAWLFTLDDGARWLQSDQLELARTPKAGQHIRIRRAAMGSYLANIEKQVAVRVKRIN